MYRRKEAFSDGVSSNNKSWYEIIQQFIEEQKDVILSDEETDYYEHNTPTTDEQKYYRHIFDREFPSCHNVVPYFWMPKYIDAKDSSARTLPIYNKQQSRRHESF